MRILLTNDDGIEAAGLKTLAAILAETHEVFVVAPDRERSATGHAITMHKPIYPETVDWGKSGITAWKVNGTPADCVKLAIRALLPTAPDLVLAGINHGSNLGRDIFYSGTVSAAMEAMFTGVPALALSAKTFDQDSLAWIAAFVAQWLNSPRWQGPTAGECFNVNFPDLGQDLPGRLVWVPLGHREYQEKFWQHENPRGQRYYWLAGEPRDPWDDNPSDVNAIHQGLIAATPIDLDVTARQRIDQLEAVEVARLSITHPPKRAR